MVKYVGVKLMMCSEQEESTGDAQERYFPFGRFIYVHLYISYVGVVESAEKRIGSRLAVSKARPFAHCISSIK